jgi:hypothetical protein
LAAYVLHSLRLCWTFDQEKELPMRALKMLLLILPLTLIVTLPAMANTCNDFATYTCAKSTPDRVHFMGTGTTGGSVGILLGSNTFSVTVTGNADVTGDDLIILAAAPNGLTGTINGVGFTSLSSFPEGGAQGAIQDTWTALGIAFNNVELGYANVGTIGSLPISLTAAGVGVGTALYAEVVDHETGQILFITPNSEAGIMNGGTSVTPEPASLTLLGTGLAGLAGLVRRKAAKS